MWNFMSNIYQSFQKKSPWFIHTDISNPNEHMVLPNSANKLYKTQMSVPSFAQIIINNQTEMQGHNLPLQNLTLFPFYASKVGFLFLVIAPFKN